MEAWMYRASWYCDDCIEAIIDTQSQWVSLEDRDDSDTWPQGPYSHGGGESDTPSHCDQCHKFLENPLTSDGADYVRDSIIESLQPGDGSDLDVNAEWAEFYEITLDDLIEHARANRKETK